MAREVARAAAREVPRQVARELAGQVAQLVEHATENRGVGGSIPPLATEELRGGLRGIGRIDGTRLDVRGP